ncbi:tyrosine-type recombinase/integrase [Cupriavidus sp. CuC1]|uniref:tyrosine-type recombinase/integrase n=1 Tax=Cupriavidus sp. CuC1 TaxID=3373131 RepID=UPI0037D12617
MNGQPSLARHLESFFHHRLTQQRNATRATVAAYRDALRLLVLFASERTGKKPCALAVEDLDRDMILAYLDHLEHSRGNCVHTRNARLTAIRSFFHHVAASDPGSIGVAQRVLSIPSKKSDVPMPHYLSRAELDALLDAPSKSSPCGRRDRVLLLFLARTGARVSEALGVEAADLSLDGARSHVMLRGKGRKQRVVPLARDLVAAIESLLRESGIARHDPVPVFVGARGERLTRFGAIHIVRRAVATASKHMPELARKEISPHVFRHSLAMMLLQSGVDLLTIQAWLGHAQVATTHRYAAADIEMMRRGLDKAAIRGSAAHRFQPKDAVLSLLERL